VNLGLTSRLSSAAIPLFRRTLAVVANERLAKRRLRGLEEGKLARDRIEPGEACVFRPRRPPIPADGVPPFHLIEPTHSGVPNHVGRLPAGAWRCRGADGSQTRGSWARRSLGPWTFWPWVRAHSG